jgi:hypothetical protein
MIKSQGVTMSNDIEFQRLKLIDNILTTKLENLNNHQNIESLIQQKQSQCNSKRVEIINSIDFKDSQFIKNLETIWKDSILK